jgi:hypothetical protein
MGTRTIRATVCDRIVKLRATLPTAQVQALGGRVGRRQLQYWNESPNTSYLYGVATFVDVSMVRRTLYFRAVRVVPVCASLRLTYSW